VVAAPKWRERKAGRPYVSPSAAGSYVGGGVGGSGERVVGRGLVRHWLWGWGGCCVPRLVVTGQIIVGGVGAGGG